MRSQILSGAVFGGALACIALFGGACVVETTPTNNTVSTGGTTGAGGSSGTGGTGGTAGTGGTGGTAGTGGTGGSAGAPGTSLVRFAHLAPDVGAVDLCFRAKGAADWSETNASGPYFAAAGDAQAFYYPGVSTFIEIQGGDYDFRLVAAGAANCLTPFSASFADQAVTIGESTDYTVVLTGEQATALVMSVHADQAAPPAGTVGYQAFNVLTQSGPADFGLVDDSKSPAEFTTLAQTLIPLGNSATVSGPATDFAPGFLNPTEGTLFAQGLAISMQAGDRYTAFLHGTRPGGPAGTEPAVIYCAYDRGNTRDPSSLIATRACCYGSNPDQDCTKP
jgi:hypothetical protein